MNIYVASSVRNKTLVQDAFRRLEAAGHSVVTDWTVGDEIAEIERDVRCGEIRAVAERDLAGIQDCDAFIMLSEPSEGRSMYVEFGVALALHYSKGKPAVFVVGRQTKQCIFYYDPAVERLCTMGEAIERLERMQTGRGSDQEHEGHLEEYRALRAEMIEIVKDRAWGQATYMIAAGALIGLSRRTDTPAMLVFLIWLAIPFLVHTKVREEARIRMANYLRAVLEPSIAGVHWESHLAWWRKELGAQKGRGWLKPADRAQHLLAHTGVYALVPVACFCLLLQMSKAPLLLGLAGIALLAMVVGYVRFYRLYEEGAADYRRLLEAKRPW